MVLGLVGPFLNSPASGPLRPQVCSLLCLVPLLGGTCALFEGARAGATSGWWVLSDSASTACCSRAALSHKDQVLSCSHLHPHPSPHHALSLLGVLRYLPWPKQRTLSYSLEEGLCPLRVDLSVPWVPSWGQAVRASVHLRAVAVVGALVSSHVPARGVHRGWWPMRAC